MGLETTALMLLAGGTAFSASMSIIGGQEEAKEIERQGIYNAAVYKQQAGLVEEEKKLEAYQYNRAMAKIRGTTIARTAGKGLTFSGSPVAIMIDNETQMRFDKAIGQYNLEVKRRGVLSGAAYTRTTAQEQARLARFGGYSNAFSTALSRGYNLALLGRA